MSPDACLSLCCRIALVGVAISSAELLAIRREFGTCGVFDWRILRTCYFLNPRSPLAARAWAATGSYAAVVAILAVRFSASAFYIVLPNSQLAPAALALAVAGTLYIHFRCVYGLDGSDQMGLIVTMTGLLAALPSDPSASAVGLWFIAGQSCLAYTASGIAKLIATDWRSGQAIAGVLGTEIYGARWLGRFLHRRPSLCRSIGWTIIVFESCFCIILLGWTSAATGLLAMGLLFHLCIAIVMGLNVFFWSFVSTYPALIYCFLSRA